MRKWWKVVAILLGLAGPTAVQAQYPGPGGGQQMYQPAFANNPQPISGPEFAPSIVQGPFETNGFTPPREDPANAFVDDCRPRRSLSQKIYDGVFDLFSVAQLNPSNCEPLTFYAKYDYLLWDLSDDRIPITLVTSTTATANLGTQNGSIGQSGTVALYGPSDINYGTLSGNKLAIGLAPTNFPLYLEVTYFALSQSKTLFRDTSNGDKVLARPITATNLPAPFPFLPGLETVFLSGFPQANAQFGGTININSTIDFRGIEANGTAPLIATDVLTLQVVGGYRYIQLKESLAINSSLVPFQPVPGANFNGSAVGTDSTVVNDFFRTNNEFNGAQIGGRSSLALGRTSLTLEAKFAFGSTRQNLNIFGQSTVVDPAGSSTVSGGLLALPSNSGDYSRDRFSVVPEVNLTAGFLLTRNVRFFASYNFLYWSEVVRPGAQLTSRQVNTAQVPTESPAIFTGSTTGPPFRTFTTSDLMVNGVSVGFLFGF